MRKRKQKAAASVPQSYQRRLKSQLKTTDLIFYKVYQVTAVKATNPSCVTLKTQF